MTFGVFKLHGTFSVRLEGQILIQDVDGPWNEEMVQIWAPALLPYAQKLDAQGPWAALVVFHGSLLTSPPAIQRMRRAIAYSTQTFGVVAHAAAADAALEGYSFAAPILRPIYEGLTPFECFTSAPDALAWLQGRIDAAQPLQR
jgi:hypothetical protein